MNTASGVVPAGDRIYLDHNATTPIHKTVQSAVQHGMELYGNPSSDHATGKAAAQALQLARCEIAEWINAAPEELMFTASGSEANNAALKGVAFRGERGRGHIVTSKIEHSCVLEACQLLERIGYQITYLPVDSTGRVDPDMVRASVRDDTLLVAVMYANNETGVIQPVKEIGAITERSGVLFFSDAVQTAGKLPLNFAQFPGEMLSFSAHKFYGPKGIGVLVVRDGLQLEPLVHGGGQEFGRRGGTENLPAILGLAAACRHQSSVGEAEGIRQRMLRDLLWNRLQVIGDIRLNGDMRYMLPGTLNVSFANVRSDALLLALDLENISVSAGSACHASRAKTSHVLEAMGITGTWLHGALRFSLGLGTTMEQISRVADAVECAVKRLRSVLPKRTMVA